MTKQSGDSFPVMDGETLLFIGDSITDCGRREDEVRHLGGGYVALIADFLAARFPERRIRVENRGIGGDRVLDLQKRWQKDVLDEKPDWLSISIGINDVWRRLGEYPEEAVPLESFQKTYEKLLEQTRKALSVKLVLMETSVIDENPESEGNRLLADYNGVIRDLANRYEARLVPIREAFFKALAARPGYQWTEDGVHPRPPGHMLMALSWLQTLGAL